MGTSSTDLERALLSMDQLEVRKLLSSAIESSAPIRLVDEYIVPALQSIGERWEKGEVALSQVYMSGRILEGLVDSIISPDGPLRKAQPRLAIATLSDYHFLGKRIVYSTLRASGYDLLDYGRVEVGEVVNRVKNDRIGILLLSTLMLPSALLVREVRSALDREGLATRIVVGGAPFRFDDRLWMEVGADAMGANASQSAEIVARMS